MRKTVTAFLLFCFAVSAAISAAQSALAAIDYLRPQKGLRLHSLSEQFVGLRPVFKNLRRAGYYTDKNLDISLAVAQFELAQYVLAPTVLELNNTRLPLVIFDCTSPQTALARIKELNLIPVSASNSGIILAVNPQVKP